MAVQPLLLVLVDAAFRRAYQIEGLPVRIAHFFQNRFAGNAAIHDPYAPRFAVAVLDLLQNPRSVEQSAVLPFMTS
jgi:hypothetical protein